MNPLKSPGMEVDQEEQVLKILYSLKGSEWIQKQTAIEESKDPGAISFEDPMGKLKAFEMQMKMDDSSAPKLDEKVVATKAKEVKNIAFIIKMQVVDESDSESSDEDVDMVTNNIAKFLIANKKKTGSMRGKQ